MTINSGKANENEHMQSHPAGVINLHEKDTSTEKNLLVIFSKLKIELSCSTVRYSECISAFFSPQALYLMPPIPH